MTKSYVTRILRSLLFVPGHNEKMARKASTIDADCIVLDLQDAVPQAEKASARALIRKLLEEGVFANKNMFVRVNPLEDEQTLVDLEAVACSQLNGFIYPMAYTAEDIVVFDSQLRLKETSLGLSENHFSIIVLIETAMGVLNAYPIANASERVIGLLFGCEDYLADIQGRHNNEEMSLHTARSNIVHACRAVGIEPIDTPYVNVHDLDGLRTFASRARDLGMAGMLAMSPKQLPIIHEIYSPSEAEISMAKRLVMTAEESAREGHGIAIVDGMFISPPTLRLSRKTLQRAEAITEKSTGV